MANTSITGLETLPSECIACISSFLTVGQLSNVAEISRACHSLFWLENEGAWREIGARYHAVMREFGVPESEMHGRVAVVHSLQLVDKLWRHLCWHKCCETYPDLASLLYDGPRHELRGFRVFAYSHTHELKAAIHDITKQQCCGSGVLHIVRGDNDVDMMDALCAMDAAHETMDAAGGNREVYCYLAEWPPQTRAHDLVLLFTGALTTNTELLEKIPDSLQHRVLLAHRPNVEVSSNDVQILIESSPLVAATESFCQNPDYASCLGAEGTSREKYMDWARFCAVECGKGSNQAQTLVLAQSGGANVHLRRTFLPYEQ